jgi:hypothetical protein
MKAENGIGGVMAKIMEIISVSVKWRSWRENNENRGISDDGEMAAK